MKTTIREIGSDFWDAGPTYEDRIFTLSGRTALELIVSDIVMNHDIRYVLLPSYCCHTMIEPFIRHKLTVKFYDVLFDETKGLVVDLPEVSSNDIFYYMTYFGFHQISMTNHFDTNFKKCITIEDKTHSWICDNSISMADYCYVSYRKWTGLAAIGMAYKRTGSFLCRPNITNSEYIGLRKKAFELKAAYINDGIGFKQDYLDIFSQAEKLLEKDYVGYTASSESMASLLNLDLANMKNIRRQNASILIDGLKNIHGLQMMFTNIGDDDVPLFVPIILDNRDDLREYLNAKSIYCPVHWPLSNFHSGISKKAERLYRTEISLVCDQRYGSDEMHTIVEAVNKYFGG